ncbi:TPM domain-containing protein, partial [Amylibacter sp.]|nr:TPM domain-containing protein [Amylibacter sp.]
EFSYGLFKSWNLGNLARNDGVLILISRSDGEMRIEVGSSYGEIYNKRMGLVIQNHFLPYFQGNQIAEGIELGTYEIINRLQPTYDIIDPNQLDKITLNTAIKRTSFWRVIEDKYLLIVFIGIVLFLNFETRMRDILIGLQRCPNCRRGQLRREKTIKKT